MIRELTEYVLPQFDVVSFDVFDTFLLRPFIVPADLFKVIGGDEFAVARRNAERAAGPDTGWLYTIDDIYARMPPGMQKMKQVEIDAEKRRAVVNPVMRAVYDRARELRMKIVFVSDMYLTEDIMRDLLASRGITEYDGVYTSCSRKHGKGDGSLLRIMADDIGVEPGRVVHIGDSVGSDVVGGERAGMYTQYIPKIQDMFFNEEKHIAEFYRQRDGRNNEHIRIFVGALVLAWHLIRCKYGDDPWRRTGCTFSAPILYCYTKWVLEQQKALGKKKLALLLRDCHAVGKILDRISPDTEYSYVAATRSITLPILRQGLHSPAGMAGARYLKEAIPDPFNTLVVEGTSGTLSCERALFSAFESHIPVVYLNRSFDHNTPQDCSYIKHDRYSWIYGMLESLLLAPFNPFSGIGKDGKPELKPESPYDAYRNYGVRRREEMVVETAALLEANGETLNPEECQAFILCCWDHLGLQDIPMFMNFYSEADENHARHTHVYWR